MSDDKPKAGPSARDRAMVQRAFLTQRLVTSGAWAKLTDAARSVYTVLIAHANEHQETYPSRKRIAELTGLADSTVGRARRALQELGLLTRVKGAQGHGRGVRAFQLNPNWQPEPGLFDPPRPEPAPTAAAPAPRPRMADADDTPQRRMLATYKPTDRICRNTGDAVELLLANWYTDPPEAKALVDECGHHATQLAVDLVRFRSGKGEVDKPKRYCETAARGFATGDWQPDERMLRQRHGPRPAAAPAPEPVKIATRAEKQAITRRLIQDGRLPADHPAMRNQHDENADDDQASEKPAPAHAGRNEPHGT